DGDGDAGLLHRLPGGALLDRLVNLHEAARVRPEAVARLDGPPQQQDAAAALRDDAGDHLRVDVEDVAAVADQARTVLRRQEADDKGGAAARAVLEFVTVVSGGERLFGQLRTRECLCGVGR